MPVLVPPGSSVPRRIGVLLAGLLLLGPAVASMIRAEIGVAPYDVLNTGLRDLLGIPISLAAVIVPAVFLALGVALGGRPGAGTVLALALVGPMIGAALVLLPDPEALLPRVGLFGVGFLLATLGITLVIVADAGVAPPELLMLALHHRGLPLAPVRAGIEAASVGVGWAMGGQVGAGTLAFAIAIGPALRHTLETLGYDARAAVAAGNTAVAGT